ncbi:MAG: transporter ATP-binding protein [Actinomycetia bacterium]|nr:transporter ATP-binding protein [Actinomycetes bacterium]
MAAIEFEQVGKAYDGKVWAVRHLDLTVADGEFVVLVGPSGCGKTTALRMLAGLEQITEGSIRIGGRRVNDVDPRDRDIAMVFQNYALYPHMNVYDNIGFGLRMQRVPKEERRAKIEHAARILGLTDHLKRKPGQLSGGQRQRVAMGRAIVREPQAFLMDEPLSNLDARLRVQMRTEISRIQHELGVTTVYVTHDQVEAMTMAHRVAVLRRGSLQQLDTPQGVYDRPANLFVASFIGSPAMNLLEGRIERRDDRLVCTLGDRELPIPDELAAARPALAGYVGRLVAVGIRPEHLTGNDGGDAGAVISARVKVAEALGSEVLVHAEIDAAAVVRDEILEGLADADETELVAELGQSDTGKAVVIARLPADADVRAGQSLELAVDVRKLHFFDLEDGTAIAR